MELFWEDIPALVGKRIAAVRYTVLGSTLGESLVVVVCADGTLVRLRCGELGCEVAELAEGEGGDQGGA